ncbi:MAG: hypothetical protein HY922_04065 [Elusimicrobia bacterium]|nr:hypothetical protein [Elusimicrobiota bacterium]
MSGAEKPPGPQRLARLIKALDNPSQRAREKARQALKQLTGKDCGPDPGPWRDWWKKYAHLRCNRCGKPLYDQELYYLVKARITSEPSELVFSEEDMTRDHDADIRDAIERMKDRPAQEVEDEVFVLLDYYLCLGCKRAHVAAVRKGLKPG